MTRTRLFAASTATTARSVFVSARSSSASRARSTASTSRSGAGRSYGGGRACSEIGGRACAGACRWLCESRRNDIFGSPARAGGEGKEPWPGSGGELAWRMGDESRALDQGNALLRSASAFVWPQRILGPGVCITQSLQV